MKRTNFVWAFALAFAMSSCGGEAPKTDEKEQEKPKEEQKEEKKEEPKPEALSEEAKKLAKKWDRKSYTHDDGKVEEVKSKEELELKADGTFEESFGGKPIATGTWSMKDKELVLAHLTGQEKDQKEKHKVQEATDAKLVLLNEKGKKETYEAVK